jgi:hypothetical protein
MVSRYEQVRQCRHHEQHVVVRHAAIADLGKAEDALGDQECSLTLASTLDFLLFFSVGYGFTSSICAVVPLRRRMSSRVVSNKRR